MKNMDNRVRYTKMVLQQALLKILEEKEIARVTVKELCEEAKVNRGTFYLHYSTPNDVLMEIEQQFVDDCAEHFTSYFEGTYEIDYLAALFVVMLNNKDTCRIIMGPHGNPRYTERMNKLVRKWIVDSWCKELPEYSRENLNYLFDYVFYGSMKLMLDWIRDDNDIPAEELANRLDRLGYYCLLAISEFNP